MGHYNQSTDWGQLAIGLGANLLLGGGGLGGSNFGLGGGYRNGVGGLGSLLSGFTGGGVNSLNNRDYWGQPNYINPANYVPRYDSGFRNQNLFFNSNNWQHNRNNGVQSIGSDYGNYADFDPRYVKYAVMNQEGQVFSLRNVAAGNGWMSKGDYGDGVRVVRALLERRYPGILEHFGADREDRYKYTSNLKKAVAYLTGDKQGEFTPELYYALTQRGPRTQYA